MKFLVTLLLLIAVVFSASPIWKNCSKSNAHLKIQEIKITPDPPVIGQAIDVIIQASLDETLNGGIFNITLDWYRGGKWTPIYEEKKAICDEIKCPRKSGHIDFSRHFEIPKITPKDKYRGELLATDQNKQELVCLEFQVDLE